MDQSPSYNFFNSSVSAWDAMYQAILSAQKSIYWEVYGLADDVAGGRFVDLLCEKASQGLDIKLILDGVGSINLSGRAEAKMRLSGIKIIWHNRVNFDFPKIFLKRLFQRNHRKILVIDKKIIFVGGVNVLAQALDWYDLHLRVESEEAARKLLKYFAKSYIRCGGKKEEVINLLRPERNIFCDDEEHLKFIMHSPAHNIRHPFYLRRFYWSALRSAKETFNLVTPYYVPDTRFLQLLSKAVKRGVKTNILLPWRPDHRFMQWVAHAFYEFTSKTGASIYFLKKMNHAKAFSVDNSLGMVGSVNLTPRSFFINHEICAYFKDKNMVSDLNNIFESWRNEAVPLSDVGWQKRGWTRRFREWWMKKIGNYV